LGVVEMSEPATTGASEIKPAVDADGGSLARVAVPGIFPGDFAQDAFYAVGFGDNPRFKALVARAKAQAAATKLELDKVP
jgi:hypothetical protein